MKLLIRREQKTGLMGKSKYILYVRAQLTDTEANLVHKNRLENELLLFFDKDAHSSGYFRQKKDEGGFMGMAVSLLRDVSLTVAKLIEGTSFTCDNVGQLLNVENQTVEAAKMLKRYIDAAATFGGEQGIDIDAILRKEDEEG